MLEINLFDTTFGDQACSVALQTPQTMRYVRNQTRYDGITVFVDGMIYDPVVEDVQSTYKVAWLHEARTLHPENYERIWQVMPKFDAVMTHDERLLDKWGWRKYSNESGEWKLDKATPFIKTIRGGSWVSLDQWGMYPKSKNVAMILSDKQTLPGHQLRHAIAAAGLPIDLFGPSYTPIGHDKAPAYRDYRFAVVVEACKEDNFFSEHLIDALAYGCVPIYWGCPNIGDYFDPDGMWNIQTSTWGDNPLIAIKQTLAFFLGPSGLGPSGTYQKKAPALIVNQTLARAYAITEDWQVEHIYTPLLEGKALW